MKTSEGKIRSLAQAAALVPAGAHISLSGFAHSLAPVAFARQLARAHTRGLEISAIGEAWCVDLLCGAGAISKIRLSNFMFEGWGRCHNFSRAVETGSVDVEDYSHYGMANRFFAGGIGLPFMPTRVMQGTDIARIRSHDGEGKFKELECPFTGDPLLLTPAVQPDYAIVHAARADAQGNTQLFGISSTSALIAKAARRTIVTVEEIVTSEEIRRTSYATIIPGFLVEAVVRAPYGAHPAGMFGYYDYDAKHIDEYVQASRSPEGFAAYLDRFVYGTKDEEDYLSRIGLERLLELRADPHFGYSLKVRGHL